MTLVPIRRAAPGLLFAAAVLVVWADPLFTARNFTGRDMLAYNLPAEKTIHSAYAAGHMPVWNPFVSGGRPLLPNPNAGAMYPLRPLLAPLSFPLAMRVYPILHWIAAGVGILLLARSLGAGQDAAWIAAATYVFSGASISESFFPHILPGFTLLPWILWAFRRTSRTPLRGALLLGAFFGLDFLAGDVFTSALAVGVCLLWLATETARADVPVFARRLSAAVVLGALVAAPQIVATALWIPETNRSILGMKLSEATMYSVPPFRLLEYLVPYPFGDTWELRVSSIWGWKALNGRMGLFSTLYVGALAPLAVVRLRRDTRAGLSFARWLLGLALAVAIIPALLPASWKSWSSPVALRNPEKFVVGAVFALAIFVAWAFDEFRLRPVGRKAALGVGAALALASLAATLGSRAAGIWIGDALGTLPRHGAIAAAKIPGSLAEAGLLWMATVVALEMARAEARSIGIAALVLLAAVPVAANRKLAEISEPGAAFAPTAFALRVRQADPSGAFRVLGEEIYRRPEAGAPATTDVDATEQPRRDWTYQTPALWELGTVLNYDFDSGDLARIESLRKVSGWGAGFRDSGPFFGNICLRFGIRRKSQIPVSAFRRFGGDAKQDWDELAQAYPEIRLATQWREEADPISALRAISRIGAGELLIETGRATTGRARPGALQVLEKTPGRLRLVCDVPDPTWLFVLRDFWTHRTVEVDGHDTEAVPAYLAFSAVPVPAGRHRIDWRERIPGITVSQWGPVLFLLAAAWAFRPTGNRPQNPSESKRESSSHP